jgi:hypothetical protein
MKEVLGVNEVSCLIRVALMDLPVYFTGVLRAQFNYEVHGQAVWGGLVSFRTGQVKLYFFQCILVLELRELEGPRILDYLQKRVQEFHEKIEGMLRLGHQGFLPLSNRRARPCTGVYWLNYHEIGEVVGMEMARLSAALPRRRMIA